MAHISADRVKETTTSTGTGAVTLAGAVTGFRAFSAVMANTDTCWYCIAGQTGSEWEIGLGTWGTGGILTRTTILKSSNANAVVALSAGTKDVFITLPADKILDLEADGTALLPATTDPSAIPAANSLKLYSKNVGGRILPKWIGPAGVDTPFQPFLGVNHIRLVQVASGTTTALATSQVGTAPVVTAAGTNTQSTAATGTLKSRTRYVGLATAATAGQLSAIRGQQLECGRETGFFLVMRFGLETMIATQNVFFGLYAAAAAIGATTNLVTATTPARVGLACAVNTGNWQLVICSGAAVTATDLGASFPLNNTDLMELVLYCAPGGTVISYRVTNLTSGAQVSGDLSGNIPGATAYMTYQMHMTNNAAASIVKWNFKVMYLETDY